MRTASEKERKKQVSASTDRNNSPSLLRKITLGNSNFSNFSRIGFDRLPYSTRKKPESKFFVYYFRSVSESKWYYARSLAIDISWRDVGISGSSLGAQAIMADKNTNFRGRKEVFIARI